MIKRECAETVSDKPAATVHFELRVYGRYLPDRSKA